MNTNQNIENTKLLIRTLATNVALEQKIGSLEKKVQQLDADNQQLNTKRKTLNLKLIETIRKQNDLRAKINAALKFQEDMIRFAQSNVGSYTSNWNREHREDIKDFCKYYVDIMSEPEHAMTFVNFYKDLGEMMGRDFFADFEKFKNAMNAAGRQPFNTKYGWRFVDMCTLDMGYALLSKIMISSCKQEVDLYE